MQQTFTTISCCLPQVLFSGYLGMGPWGAAQYLEGEPLGLIMLGKIMYHEEGQRHWMHHVDTSIPTVSFMATYLLPMTLLCASVASR